MKDLALACHNPRGTLGLPWKVGSRLESRGRSLDLEENSCKGSVGSALALEVECQFGAILQGPGPFPKILPPRSLPHPRCSHPSCFSIIIKPSRERPGVIRSKCKWGLRRKNNYGDLGVQHDGESQCYLSCPLSENQSAPRLDFEVILSMELFF